MIYYGKQSVSTEDIEAVRAVLASDFLTQGPAIEKFEEKVASYCGARYAVAVCNATAALHIACRAAGLSEGGLLWTVPNTFVASANCGRYCGADVDFVDIDGRTYNMNAVELKEKLDHAKKKPDILIPVHFSGQPCDMEEIHALAKQHGVTVIEDASHAVGAEYRGERIGSCKYSDMTVFSFHPVKIITTGEGGMVLTNDEKLYERLKLFRSHGITRDAVLMGKNDGPWYYEQVELGFNYRMTDIQAALGASQMERLPLFLERRRYLAARYDELLKDSLLTLPYQKEGTLSSWHLYVVRLPQSLKNRKAEIFAAMREKGVTLNLHYIPVHLQPYYRDLGFSEGDYPVSESYYEEVFSLPLYYSLSDEEQEYIADILQQIINNK